AIPVSALQCSFDESSFQLAACLARESLERDFFAERFVCRTIMDAETASNCLFRVKDCVRSHQILQLADVPWPVVVQEEAYHCSGERPRLSPVSGAIKIDEVAGEFRNLVAPFSESRDSKSHCVDSIEQIQPEASIDRFFLEVAICRAENSGLNLQFF